MKHPRHGFHKTEIEHHHDGSHTIHHHHVDPEQSIHHAVPDHDAMMDSMQKNLGEAAPDAQIPEPQGAAPEPMVQ
jgi:hypothetical protein